MGPQPLPLAFIANKDLFTLSVAFDYIEHLFY